MFDSNGHARIFKRVVAGFSGRDFVAAENAKLGFDRIACTLALAIIPRRAILPTVPILPGRVHFLV